MFSYKGWVNYHPKPMFAIYTRIYLENNIIHESIRKIKFLFTYIFNKTYFHIFEYISIRVKQFLFLLSYLIENISNSKGAARYIITK